MKMAYDWMSSTIVIWKSGIEKPALRPFKAVKAVSARWHFGQKEAGGLFDCLQQVLDGTQS